MAYRHKLLYNHYLAFRRSIPRVIITDNRAELVIEHEIASLWQLHDFCQLLLVLDQLKVGSNCLLYVLGLEDEIKFRLQFDVSFGTNGDQGFNQNVTIFEGVVYCFSEEIGYFGHFFGEVVAGLYQTLQIMHPSFVLIFELFHSLPHFGSETYQLQLHTAELYGLADTSPLRCYYEINQLQLLQPFVELL